MHSALGLGRTVRAFRGHRDTQDSAVSAQAGPMQKLIGRPQHECVRRPACCALRTGRPRCIARRRRTPRTDPPCTCPERCGNGRARAESRGPRVPGANRCSPGRGLGLRRADRNRGLNGGSTCAHALTCDRGTRQMSPNASFSMSSMKMALPTSPRRRRTSRIPMAPRTSINWLCQAPIRFTILWVA